MRTIGLIGGMSWESTRLYYDAINIEVRNRLGGLHSAKLILHSVDFQPVADMQAEGRWDEAGALLAEVACGLERAGAECIGLCTNTMHKVAPHIMAAVRIPFLHIADATAAALRAGGKTKPFLMATRFTMEQDFYKGLLAERGVQVSIPDERGRDEVHRIIYEQLCRGDTRESSRLAFVAQTEGAMKAGADSVILGCTEVGMLLNAKNSALPPFDTTLIHTKALVDFALGSSSNLSQ